MTAAAQLTSTPASAIFGQPCANDRRTEPQIQALTDADREAAIKRAGAAMEKHYFDWACTGSFASLGDSHRARILMQALIAGRSKDAVLTLEIKRGLI